MAIANGTTYGLQAYLLGADPELAARVAKRILAGRVLVNPVAHEPMAPFGGFKQSGIRREFGTFGIEAFLEPKAILGLAAAGSWSRCGLAGNDWQALQAAAGQGQSARAALDLLGQLGEIHILIDRDLDRAVAAR